MMNSLGLDFALNLGDMVHPLPQSPEYITAAKRYFELSAQLNCIHYCDMLANVKYTIGEKGTYMLNIYRYIVNYSKKIIQKPPLQLRKPQGMSGLIRCKLILV